MSYRFADSLRAGEYASVRKLSANLYDIYHCCVCSEKIPDDGQRNCPKHVEFHSKNKFEKLVHMVGLITINITSTFSLNVLATVLKVTQCLRDVIKVYSRHSN
jgi:predicted nucleic acid-binding Zn ribbon protein